MGRIKDDTRRDYAERMLLVLNYIQGHLDEPISLDALAEVACFSPFHFHRIFRGMVGESVMAHVRRLRLERAASRLKNGRRSVIDIALEAGYETHESFTRAFGEMFGASPTAYRASRGDRAAASRVHYNDGRSVTGFAPCDGGTDMNVEVIRFEPVTVAYVRHVGPYPECGRAWEKLCTWAGPLGLLGAGTRFLGLCYDDPEVTAPEKIRYDACITVDGDVSAGEGIALKELEGGDYARTTHFGPYDKLGETYAALCGQWCPANGYELASKPSIEIYHNSPEDTDPEDLITDVHVPIE